jgi:hypothetical protein
LVSTVSWCKQPEIKALVHDIFAKTDDASVLLAALPGIESTDNTLIRDRIQSFLNEVPSTEQVDHDYQLLQAAADRLGSASSPMFDGFLKNGNPDRCYTVTQVLRGTRDPWAIDILRRLLSDRRNIGDYTYATGKSDDGPRLPIRVCDVAAQVLADTRPNLKFMLEGQYSDLDKQIAVMQKALLK